MKMNIFEGAKFGDRFITKNNQLAIFISRAYNDRLEFIYQPQGCIYSSLTTTSDGQCCDDEENDLDVVGRYTEPIDEFKLDEITKERYPLSEKYDKEEVLDAFKAGYRKAKEE